MEVDWSHYIGEELSFRGFDLESCGVGDVRSARGLKTARYGEVIEVDVSEREVFYVSGMQRASRSSSVDEWDQLTGAVAAGNGPTDLTELSEFRDLEVLMWRDAGWSLEVSILHPVLGSAWGAFVAKLKTNSMAVTKPSARLIAVRRALRADTVQQKRKLVLSEEKVAEEKKLSKSLAAELLTAQRVGEGYDDVLQRLADSNEKFRILGAELSKDCAELARSDDAKRSAKEN